MLVLMLVSSKGALPGDDICKNSNKDTRMKRASLEQSKVDETCFPGGAARRRKELKFSWDDRVKHEDWGIQKVEHPHDTLKNHFNLLLMMMFVQVKIEGFDPEKFRKVNT